MGWAASLVIALAAIVVNTVVFALGDRRAKRDHEVAMLKIQRDHAQKMCEGYRDSWARLTRNPPHVLSWEEDSDG